MDNAWNKIWREITITITSKIMITKNGGEEEIRKLKNNSSQMEGIVISVPQNRLDICAG